MCSPWLYLSSEETEKPDIYQDGIWKCLWQFTKKKRQYSYIKNNNLSNLNQFVCGPREIIFVITSSSVFTYLTNFHYEQMIDEKTPNNKKNARRTMHNQGRNKNTKLSPLRYSTFIRARRVKHPYNVRTLLLLRSRKIQSKPVSQTWHKSAGHFQLMISLFKLKFHVVHASFFLKFTWLVMLWCCVVRFWNNGKAQWGDVICWYHLN